MWCQSFVYSHRGLSRLSDHGRHLGAIDRNLLLHAMIEYYLGPPSWVRFIKAVAGKPGQMREYDISVDDIKEAAVSMGSISSYLHALVDCIGVPADDVPGEDSLPEKPLLPRKLSLRLLEEGPEDEPPLPQPSRE
jgi:hypothetical protein